MKELVKKCKDLLPAAVTMGIFILLFSTVQWPEMWRVLVRIDRWYFFAAIAAALLASTVIGSERLRMIIRVLGGRVSFREVLLIKMGSLPLNLLPSGQADLLSQAVYFKKNMQVSLAFSIHYIVLALYLNVLALLIPVAITLVFFWPAGDYPLAAHLKPLIACFCAAGITPLLIWGMIRARKLRKYFLSWLQGLNAGWALRAGELCRSYDMISGRGLLQLLVYSMGFQYVQFLVYYLLARSLGLDISLVSIFLFLPVVIIVSHVPLTIAGFGLRESLILFFFASHGGKEAILALGMLFSFAEYLAPAFIGLFFMGPYLKKVF